MRRCINKATKPLSIIKILYIFGSCNALLANHTLLKAFDKNMQS